MDMLQPTDAQQHCFKALERFEAFQLRADDSCSFGVFVASDQSHAKARGASDIKLKKWFVDPLMCAKLNGGFFPYRFPPGYLSLCFEATGLKAV